MDQLGSDGEEEEPLLALGFDLPTEHDLSKLLGIAEKNDANFACASLFHPRLRRDPQTAWTRTGACTRSDMAIENMEWQSSVIGKSSAWIDLDAPCFRGREAAAHAFEQEYSYACHVGCQAMILPSQSKSTCVNRARVLSSLLNQVPTTVNSPVAMLQIWMTIPVRKLGSQSDGWSDWNMFRHQINHHPLVHVLLDLRGVTGPLTGADRWVSEPVKGFILPTSSFFLNKKGKLVIRPEVGDFLLQFKEMQPHIILTGRALHGKHARHYRPYILYLRRYFARHQRQETQYEHFCKPYRDSLRSPQQPVFANLDSETYHVMEMDPVKYQWYETAIGQALQDQYKLLERSNADSESRSGNGCGMEGQSGAGIDVKNRNGKRSRSVASTCMNTDTNKLSKHSSVCTEHATGRVGRRRTHVVVVVVGPGRGPLVAASVRAARCKNIPVKIFAVEKNPNAVNTLRNRIVTEGWEEVTVFHSDMRDWRPPDRRPDSVSGAGWGVEGASSLEPEWGDVLVSELLGSFGDNESSPECLDYAQRCLRTPTGVSIPQRYAAYVAPLSAHKLWNDARIIDTDAMKGLETPFVVQMHRHYVPCQAEPVWTFEHPNVDSACSRSIDGHSSTYDTYVHGKIMSLTPNRMDRMDGRSDSVDISRNCRFATAEFIPSCDMTMHGLAGYFNCTLYKDVFFSTVPEEHEDIRTADGVRMSSWFPMYFPLHQPVHVKAQEKVIVNIWRCVTKQKMWYEWSLSSPVVTPIHNPNGRSSWVGL